MEQLDVCESAPNGPITPGDKGIYIEQIKYIYSITKSKEDKDSLKIKLYDPTQKSKFYFIYEASYQKLIKDIKFLSLCENIDEMIDALERIFTKGNVRVEVKDGLYNMELELTDVKKNYVIQLTRYEIEPSNKAKIELEDKINKLENKYKDLFNKYEELKKTKENDIRNTVKEIIFDKDIKLKLFEEFEQLLLSKYKFNNKNENKLENDVINKVQNIMNDNEQKTNKQIINLQKQLKENIDYLNEIKLNNNSHNFVILQVKIDENNLNKNIRLFNQVSTYKYFSNFERDDIETIIDDQIVPIKFKIWNDNDYMDINKYKKWYQGKNCDNSVETLFYLSVNFYYYWKFTTKGIHAVKLIFKKKLTQCNKLFYDCNSIYKIDCSNFDCSQISDCSEMFCCCSSVTEINLGKLDFALSESFYCMFSWCPNLEKLDVSYLNTQNSKSFRKMFSGCSKLKQINVSNFRTKNCKDMVGMFLGCKSLESIDMLNWDMSNIDNLYGIRSLFENCSSLKKIKMNFNKENYFERANKKESEDEDNKICFKKFLERATTKVLLSKEDIFNGLPENGSFIWRKGINCNKLLELLPVSWNRSQE